jgi:hypothetical protein
VVSAWYVTMSYLGCCCCCSSAFVLEERVEIMTHIILNAGQGRNPCVNDLTTILLLTDGTELTSLVCHFLCTD